jgi:class 3 adenylate cyclase
MVLHRRGNRYIRCDAGRYLADHIQGAKYVELPGDDHFWFAGDIDTVIDEVEEFLTGRHPAPEGEMRIATVMFTDIVNSTARTAAIGHRAWRTVLDQHDVLVRAVLQRHRGREVKTMGDGFLAVFDTASPAVRCATEILNGAAQIGLTVRAGIHVGEVEMRNDDVSGLGVVIAKRICDTAVGGALFVSTAVPAVVGASGIEFEDRGEHKLKGVPGTWRLFSVEP